MISTEDLYGEIRLIEDLIQKDTITDLEFQKALLKLSILQTKLLHNMRTNTVKVMDHLKIEKVKPRKREEHEKSTEKKGR